MFDYPLHLSCDTLYDTFGLGPEASAEQIRDAETEAVVSLTAEKQAIEKEVATVNEAVPGLTEARSTLLRLQAGEGSGSTNEVLEARSKLANLEQKALQLKPQFRELLKRADELERRFLELNSNPLKDPKKRQAYDQAHPPFGILKLSDCAQDGFVENHLAIHLVRSELSRFLTGKGEAILHPSDLSRDDFSDDFFPNPILDDFPP